MFADCFAGKHEKKIKICQEAIDALSKGLALVAKDEKKYRDLSVRSREEVRKLESCCQDTDKREILRLWQEAWSNLKLANDIADIAWPARFELALFESLKQREIEALQHEALTTARKTKPSCFFFWH